jgi:hypothetical protein
MIHDDLHMNEYDDDDDGLHGDVENKTCCLYYLSKKFKDISV